MKLNAKAGTTLNRREAGEVTSVQVKRVTKRGIITLTTGERFDKYGYPLSKKAK